MQTIVVERHGVPEFLAPRLQPMPVAARGQVVVRVAAAAVNFIDTLLRAGSLPPSVLPALPFVPGVECSGVVESVGEGEAVFAPGDRVIAMGGPAAGCYAEFAAFAAERVFKLPAHVDLQRAAALPVNYGTAWHMLHTLARVQRGQTVLVHAAAGGVGTALVQLARLAGVSVIGLAGSPDKVRHVLAQGADHAIDYKREDVAARVTEITGGRGVAASFNPIAGDSVVRDAALLAPFGQIVVFGMLGGMPDASITEVLIAHFHKSLAVRASDLYTLYLQQPQAFGEMMRTLLDLYADGQIAPHIHATLPLADAAEAHRQIEAGAVAGKLLLVP